MELAPGYAGGDVADVAGVGCKMETDRMTTRAMTAPMAAASDNTALIAECAYYKAERRGFEPGFELDDWLAAESEILGRPRGAPKAKRIRKNGSAAKR